MRFSIKTFLTFVTVFAIVLLPFKLYNSKLNAVILSEYEKLMQGRRAQVMKVCRESKIKTETNFANILEMKEKNMIWCPVYKAGTSSWKIYLFEIFPNLSEVSKHYFES